MKRKLVFGLSGILLFSAIQLNAQSSEQSIIKIQTYASIRVPADEIIFTINLSASEKDAQKAYEKHQTQEEDLLSLLQRLNVPDSLVTYSLMDISRDYRARKDEIFFRTRQNINVKLRDIKQYEPFQIALLSNGINDFRATFSSSQHAKAMDEVPLKGLEQAKKEAQIIANELGRKLGKILEVSTQRYRQSLTRGQALTVVSEVGSLMDIQQFVEFSTNIVVTFELID